MPVILTGFDGRHLPFLIDFKGVGSCAVRRLEKIAFKGFMVENLRRIVEQVFGHGDLRNFEVQLDLMGVIGKIKLRIINPS